MTMKLRTVIALSLLLLALLAANALADGTLTLPAGLKTVDTEAFYGVKGFEKLVIPEGVTEIRSRAFANSSVKSISFPVTLTSIAEDAFDGCGMFNVSVTVGSYAYRWCLDHGYISKPDPTPAEYFTYATINGLYAQITGYTGTDTVVVIPEKIDDYIIQKVSDNTFKNNKTIKYVCVPDTVTEIGAYAFYGCTSLVGVDVGQCVKTIDDYAFTGCKAIQDIDFPENLLTVGISAFSGCDGLTSINLPDTVTSIATGAFKDCINISDFHYPKNLEKSVTGYGFGGVFSGCKKLTRITVPEGVKKIPNYMFAYSDYLKRVYLGTVHKLLIHYNL